jgi:hypothetical protein
MERGVTILKREFHRRERDMGNEDRYYLCRDSDSGQVFVLHEWSREGNHGHEPGSERIEIDVFLVRRGIVENRLRELIGTLVSE